MTEPSSKPKDSTDYSFFERPVSRLATYYFLGSLLALPVVSNRLVGSSVQVLDPSIHV